MVSKKLLFGQAPLLDGDPESLRHFAWREVSGSEDFSEGFVFRFREADGVSTERFLCCCHYILT